MTEKYLTEAMDNVLAYRLGLIARSPKLHDPINIGDEIDRGLILRRLLEEQGFGLVRLTPYVVDRASGTDKTVVAEFKDGEIVNVRKIPPEVYEKFEQGQPFKDER